MKVIAISGSSRKDGNTAFLLKLVLEDLKKAGIETELIELYDKNINPCRACFTCEGKKNVLLIMMILMIYLRK